MTDFLRYHVLVRVFDGDASAWLEVLQRHERAQTREVIFVQWIQDRLRSDPELLTHLRHLVDTSGLWPSPLEHVHTSRNM